MQKELFAIPLSAYKQVINIPTPLLQEGEQPLLTQIKSGHQMGLPKQSLLK